MYGFKLVKKEYIKDIDADGFLYAHKSGARLLFVKNEDKNRVFMPVFNTLPTDNSGAAHIVEHCTLLGSEKYPLKDPFARLAKCSVYTYLNAITYPDKTVYPVASTDEEELYKMAQVYLNGVFKPLMLENEGIFQQEGVRFDKKGASGIVLNEMKGYFDNSLNVLYESLKGELYKSCNYKNCSAGIPKDIENLTFERFKQFYKEKYRADNCIIYVYGDLDIEKYMQLAEPYLVGQGEKKADESLCISSADKPIGVKVDKTDKLSGAVFSGCGGKNYKERIMLQVLKEVFKEEYKGTPQLEFVYNCDEKSDTFFVSAQCEFSCFKDSLKAFFDKIEKDGFSRQSIENAVNKLKLFYKEKDFGYKPVGLFYGLELVNGLICGQSTLACGNLEDVLNEAEQADFAGLFEKYFACKGVWGYTCKGENETKVAPKGENDAPFLEFINTPERVDAGIIKGKKLESFNCDIYFPEIRVENGVAFTKGKGDIVYLDLLYPIDTERVSAGALYGHLLEMSGIGSFGKLSTGIAVVEVDDKAMVAFKISMAFLRNKIESSLTELKNIFEKNSCRALDKSIFMKKLYSKGKELAALQSLSCLSRGYAVKNMAEGTGFLLSFGKENADSFSGYIKNIKPFALLRGNEKDRKYICDNIELAKDMPLLQKNDAELGKNIGFVIGSQMNCNSLSLKLPKWSAAHEVAAMIAEQYYFWDTVRSTGGAYGAECRLTKNGLLSMTSDRDLLVKETFDTFKNTGEYLTSLKLSDDDFASALISCAWKMTKPVKEKEINERVLSYLLFGDSLESEKEKLCKMLSLTPCDIKRVGAEISGNMKNCAIASIGGERVAAFFENCIKPD